MKSLLFFLTALCIVPNLNAQDINPEPVERVNNKNNHSINAYYGYFYFKDAVDNRLIAWNANIFAFGYLYSATKRTNIGIYGRYRSYITDELKWGSTDTSGNRHDVVYKYSTSAYDILFKCQFFWINTRYVGFYSSLNLGIPFEQPFKTEFISGNMNLPPYYGGFLDEADIFTPFGLKFRFGKASNWYFNLELVMRFNDERVPLLYGAGYRF